MPTTTYKKTKILIVDDHPNNLFTLEVLLKDLDQILIRANSGEEALKQALEHEFAVIIMDVQMGGMDGFETAQLLRMRDKNRYTPIIFLSALHKGETDIQRGYSLGAIDYIFKPIVPEILHSKVKVFVDLFSKSSYAQALENELNKRKRAEALARKQQRELELAHVARLNTMKEMASALAHELNHPLGTIANYLKGSINRLQNNPENIEEILTVMKRALRQSEHAGEIIHRIKNLVCKGELYYEKIDIHHLIHETLDIIADELQTAEICIDLKLAKKSTQLEADKIQLQQVLLNLLRNSLDAMHEAEIESKNIIIQTNVNKKKLLEIDIIDNGPGFSPELADKLFEAYFTTKKTGMGMGLSISRTIVEAHSGNLIAQLHKRGGAWFKLTFPLLAA